jgi:hypothetical protein
VLDDRWGVNVAAIVKINDAKHACAQTAKR